MGKTIVPKKTLQHYEAPTTDKSNKGVKHAVQQVFLQQSVTILAFKDKSNSNSTSPPDLLEPDLFLGVLSKDIPGFVGAIIGAALIVVLFLLVLTFWKCCRRMQILKKKKYWLHSKDRAKSKAKHIFPAVVQSNSVVFLGLKPTQVQDFQKMDKSLENSHAFKHEPFLTNHDVIDPVKISSNEPLPITCAPSHNSNYPVVTISSECAMPSDPTSLPSSIPALSTPMEPTYVNCKLFAQHVDSPNIKVKESSVFSTHNMNIPTIVTHCDESLQSSPAFIHRAYYSGTFDQHSLYSCQSHIGSEIDLKTCSLTWSNYNLRPSSTGDCYYDLFQRASLCKKRKNRMRSDIAAAIALNRSQSAHLNKDTDSLVENEVEIILDERTTL